MPSLASHLFVQRIRLTESGGRPSQGIGPAGDPTGTAEDRGTTTPDGNLTGPEPGNQDRPVSDEPGEIAPDSRPVRDADLLDGTRQGPAQPQ